MASKPKSGPQDLPPKGGYRPIQVSRVALRRILSPTLASGLSIASTVVGAIGFYFSYRDAKRDEVELKSAQLAIVPVLLAERDREFLKQVRKNRDEEAKLMEDYPGWEVGTYFGEPVFIGEPEDKLIVPHYSEFVVHCDPSKTTERQFRFQLL